MFTWRPILSEIVQKLSEFQFTNSSLVELMVRMKREELKVSPYLDQDANGNEFQLEELDPFTFLGIFNRSVTVANRVAIFGFLKQEWNLTAPLPSDFAGLPLVNSQKSWFMPFKFHRDPQHVPTLWKFFIRDSFKHVLPVKWVCKDEVTVPDGFQLPGQTLTNMSSKPEFIEIVSDFYPGLPGLSEDDSGPGPILPKSIEYTKQQALIRLRNTG